MASRGKAESEGGKVLSRSVPLYHQLRELLIQQIESGEWKPGRQLPTEKELSAEFSVSRATVRQALQYLQHQGLIERYPGRGTFVARPKISHNLLDMYVNPSDFKLEGAVARTVIDGLSRRPAPPNVAARLQLPLGDEVWELRRIVTVDGTPDMLITSWLPYRNFPDFDQPLLRSRTMKTFLREQYGIEGGRQHKEIEVTVLDEAEAELLAASVASPAFLFTHVSMRADGRPYEYRKMIVRGDRSKFHVDLEEPEPLV
ncbi:MAG TPA: GntR family transcriptional regulator [Dehalococcoidia bacterium]|nr:GntR family transcriptional regulator [Dehalococcoidia bacterium]